MKKIAIIGSTGSIGKSTLKVAQHLPNDFSVVSLAAHSNIDVLSQQIELFKPDIAAVYVEEKARELQARFPKLRVVSGEEGLNEAASHASIDFVVMAIVGMRALSPTIHAIQAGKPIGLASKEVFVAAGEYVSGLAKKMGVPILPIDSEHSALFQCLKGNAVKDVRRLVLTASGGPFRNHTCCQLETVSVEEALAHPTWNMGPKITVDCSTLVNKGLEMIEARWFFDLPPEKIEVIVHPQSIIHSLVEFIDGSILAQMNEPNMINPIQYALTYPERKEGMFPPFDFIKNSRLDFYAPDTSKFPALKLAFASMKSGGSSPCYLNAANEVLVDRFLKKEISWKNISYYLEKLLERHNVVATESLETVLAIDHEARREARII